MCSVLAVEVEEAIDPEAEKAVDIISMNTEKMIGELMGLNDMIKLTDQQIAYRDMLIHELKLRKKSRIL